MLCKICNSSEVQKITDFRPYEDKEWCFELFECLNCNTRYFARDSNMNYHEELHSENHSPYSSHYEVAAKLKQTMENDLKKSESFLLRKSPVIQEVLEFIKQKEKNISILEIGCSTGYVTAYLQKLGYKNSLGIDISKSAIEFASLTFGDFYALKEKNRKYDVIFHTGLIGCVDNPIEFLDHYLNLLNDDGVMFFNAPDIDSVKEMNVIWVSTPPPDLIYLFDQNVFHKFFDNRYDVLTYKTVSPIVILKKIIYKLRGKEINVYPRRFHLNKSKKSKFSTTLLKKTLSQLIRFLVRIKIVKHYPDEYGLIVKVIKR